MPNNRGMVTLARKLGLTLIFSWKKVLSALSLSLNQQINASNLLEMLTTLDGTGGIIVRLCRLHGTETLQ
jgi:hypothetical protein